MYLALTIAILCSGIVALLALRSKRSRFMTRKILSPRALAVLNSTLFNQEQTISTEVNRLLTQYNISLKIRDINIFDVCYEHQIDQNGNLLMQVDVKMSLLLNLELMFPGEKTIICALDVKSISCQPRFNKNKLVFDTKNIILDYGLKLGFVTRSQKHAIGDYNPLVFAFKCYLTYCFKRGLKKPRPAEIITAWVEQMKITEVDVLNRIFLMQKDDATKMKKIQNKIDELQRRQAVCVQKLEQLHLLYDALSAETVDTEELRKNTAGLDNQDFVQKVMKIIEKGDGRKKEKTREKIKKIETALLKRQDKLQAVEQRILAEKNSLQAGRADAQAKRQEAVEPKPQLEIFSDEQISLSSDTDGLISDLSDSRSRPDAAFPLIVQQEVRESSIKQIRQQMVQKIKHEKLLEKASRKEMQLQLRMKKKNDSGRSGPFKPIQTAQKGTPQLDHGALMMQESFSTDSTLSEEHT